jgi:hypothetical protein
VVLYAVFFHHQLYNEEVCFLLSTILHLYFNVRIYYLSPPNILSRLSKAPSQKWGQTTTVTNNIPPLESINF